MSVTMRTLVALLATLFIGGAGYGNPVPQARGPSPEEVAKLKALCKERVDALWEAYRIRSEEYKPGRATLESVLEIAKELRKAELDLFEKPEERIAALEKNLEVLKTTEELTKQKFNDGRLSGSSVALSKAARLEAEIALHRERMKAKAPAK
jgi:hypothetical protein